jgi:transcriptional regulator with XRE-family HTH domain
MKPLQIKKLRRKLQLTQEKFAEVLGVSFATVNRWENGKASPQADRVKRMGTLEAEGANRHHEDPVCGYLAKVDMPQRVCERFEYPFKEGDTVLVLGDIANMPGHCTLVTKDGRTYFGYHTADFRKLTEEEV